MRRNFLPFWDRKTEVRLIVGLGNPGAKYAGNRHNIGFMCVDRFAQDNSLSFTRSHSRAKIVEGKIAGHDIVLAKPQTFMNNSGVSVGGLVRKFKVKFENLIVIHDDLDPYWGDINDHLSQLCSLLDEYSEVVNGLADTIDTLASHRIDEVVRVLTIVTVLTLPVVVLSTVFSMNISLPFGQHPLLFFVVVGLGVALTGMLLWFLRKQKWL